MTSSLADHQPGYSVLAELHRVHKDASKLLGEEARSWYTGYLGELAVGNRLNTLRAEGYTVLHGIQPGKSDADVDHLVITPTGFVYVINTKHHRGKKVTVYDKSALINGSKVDHLKKSKAEVEKVARHLNAHRVMYSGVQGALVFVAPSAVEVKKQPADIWTLRDSEIVRKIKFEEAKRKLALPFDATLLTEPTFWREQYDWSLLAAQQERLDWFAQLTKQMARREVVRFGWLLFGLGLGALALIAALHAAGILG